MRSARLTLVALLALTFTLPATLSASTPGKSSINFMHDDYAKALKEAKAKNVPLFVEAWATWCHSCRSMQAYVFPDPKLVPYGSKFIWVGIDIDKAQNAAIKKKFVIEGVPSFFIVDPADDSVALRWLGSATVPQLMEILDDGANAVAKKGEQRVDKALAKADKLYAAGKNAEASVAYQDALAKAPKGWSRYGRTTESLLFALQSSGQYGTCVARASREYPKFKNSSSAMNIAALGLDCALSLGNDVVQRAADVAKFEGIAREAMDNSRVVVAADDRSGLFITMMGARSDAGDTAGAKAIAKEWAAFLEREASKATTPEARAVFDSHRLSAYIELGEPERAVPMLEQSAKDFPDDYNPPARLAATYKAMGKFEDAVRFADLALSRAYGPRRLTIFRTKSDAQTGAGDMEAARSTIEAAIAEAEAFPEGQRSDRTIAALKDKLASLDVKKAATQ
ncbi:MAG: thioredoxin family protein [Acidobacteria bacterium]|nr:thioredoxin family protein [Acidobacteriota bacterium]